MEKFLYYNNLYLLYKKFLNENNSEIFDLYYGDNLSMQEIADLKGVSKSRIGAIIKQTEKKLDSLEDKTHLYSTKEQLNKLLEINDLEALKKELMKVIKGENDE